MQATFWLATEISVITSLQNARVKQVVRLRQRRHRESERLFLIEGYREIQRAVEASVQIHALFTCEQFYGHSDTRTLVHQVAANADVSIEPVSREVFAKISIRENSDGLLAVAPSPAWPMNEMHVPSNGLFLISTATEKPGNLGTILRSADAAGVDGVVVCGSGTDVLNPNVVRASLGTVFSVPVAQADADSVRSWIKHHAIRIIAATPDADRLYTQANMTRSCAILLGSEHAGLDVEWLNSADDRVRLPSAGHADSINVAMAATVMLFEARRQRRLQPSD